MRTTGKKIRNEPPAFDAEGYQTNLADLNGTPLPDLTRVTAKPRGWGGMRTGAGRKPSGRKPVLLRLTPKTVGRLRKTARRLGRTISDVAEERLAGV